MKKFSIVCYAIFCVTITNAQDKLPSFGKIDKVYVAMKDCEYDPGAEAEEIFNQAEISYKYNSGVGWESETKVRVRTKVYKESGTHWAQVKIGYYSKNRYQEISNVKGTSFNLNAAGEVEETEMEKSAVYNKSINQSQSEVSFALPNVKAGTVFEYKYTLTRRSYSRIPEWHFQKSIPVRYSAYNIILPEYFKFTVQSTVRQKVEKFDKQFDGTWYIMRNVPGLKSEPYSSGRDSYLQRVEFQLSRIEAPSFVQDYRTSWPKLIEELVEDEDFGLQLKKNIKGTSDLDIQLATAKTTQDKIRIVYNYIQKNMQWNEQYGIYSEGVKSIWDKKNGNIADINFILISLLKDAGVDAKPLLASTKDNGEINTLFPFLNQFNSTLAYVKDGEEAYVMNAADKYNPYYLIPYDVLYTNALIVDKNNGGIISLESNKKFTNSIFFKATLQSDGKLTGDGTISSANYARNTRLSTYKKGNLKSVLQNNEGIEIKIDSLSVKNENDELKTLNQEIKFSGILQNSGDYSFLPITLFTGLGKNPFIEENRVMDIDLDYPQKYTISGAYLLPNEYEISELPKNTRIILPDTSIALTRYIQNDDNIISFRFTLDFNAPGYAAESYPYIKEFFKKMYEILDERIVLKKK